MNKQILTSLFVIGVIGAFATGSTLAIFNDIETSNDNVFRAGEIDLKIDHQESYNGEYQEDSSFGLMDNPNAFFNLQDVKPGDHGNGTISLHITNNPGYVWVKINGTEDLDNTCTEPEADAEGGSCGTEGELDEELEGTLWYDHDGDGVKDSGESKIATGSLSELGNQQMMLDANLNDGEDTPYQPGQTEYVGFKWDLPMETGNEVQTDSFKFDVWFYTEQARHNGNPQNPFPTAQ